MNCNPIPSYTINLTGDIAKDDQNLLSGAIIISDKVHLMPERSPERSPEQSRDRKLEFLDRHSWLPVVLLIVLPFVLHLPLWLLGRSSDPIWFFSGVTQGSQLVPGWPSTDPNVGITSQALGHLVAWDWLHGIVPWWNPYTGIGMPLAGELQPEAFFLPFNLLLLLHQGILWQQICMQIIAGLATYTLVRELGLSRLAALMGGALFALDGTIAWTPGPAAVYCTLPFLPLLLWGIERARKLHQGAVSILAIGVAIAWSILAGFPEPAFISGLLALAWGLYRLISQPNRSRMAGRAVAGFVLGLLVAAPLLIAFVDYLRQSNSFAMHAAGEISLPWAAFSTTVMPYVYGPLQVSFNSARLYQIWLGVGGYAGVLVILLAAVGLGRSSQHRGLKLLLLAWIVLAWAKTFGVQPVMAIVNHLPLLRQAGFFRYSPPSWELALIVLAAFGLDDFRERAPSRRWAFAIALGLLAIGIAAAWPRRAFWAWPQAQVSTMFLLLGLSLAWALAGFLTAALAWTLLHQERRRIALAGLLVFDAAVMFMAPQVSSIRGGRIDTQAIRFLRDHQGLSRAYALGPLEPNYSAYFQVASIDHNVLPVPKLWADYVDRNLLPGIMTHSAGVVFWPAEYGEGAAEQALSRNLAHYRDLGVRYLVTNPRQSPAPVIILPTAETSNPPIVPFKRFVLSRLPFLAHSATRTPGGKSTAETKAIVLENGQSTGLSMPAPPPASPDSAITAVGVMIGDDGGDADGRLEVEICAAAVCRSGQRALSESVGNGLFRIALEQPLVAPANAPLQLSFRRQGGSRPVSLEMASAGRTLQLAFEYGSALQGLERVYVGSAMEIWELPNPAPYFQVVQGGPCTLAKMGREDLTAECNAPATLLRRELYMPGWSVTVNGAAAAPVRQNGIFQSAPLPAGHSHTLYHFVPPYMEFGWAASLLGIAGLLWQLILIARTPASVKSRRDA